MCVYKTEDGKCKKFSDDKTTSYCVDAPCKYEKLSNYDRIRNMGMDEMAERLSESDECERFCAFTKNGVCDSCGDAEMCHIGVKLWLESEAE